MVGAKHPSPPPNSIIYDSQEHEQKKPYSGEYGLGNGAWAFTIGATHARVGYV